MGLSGLWKTLLNVLDQQWELIQGKKKKKKKNARKIYPKATTDKSKKTSPFL